MRSPISGQPRSLSVNSTKAINALVRLLLGAPALAVFFGAKSAAGPILIKGELHSTSFSPKGEAFSKAIHPFEVLRNGTLWKIRFEDSDVRAGTKLGPEYVESSFDGASVFTKFVFSQEMRTKMASDPNLQAIVSKDPKLAKAKIDYDQAKTSQNSKLMPLNTNDASVYIDRGTYPKRLMPAAKILWLAYCADGDIKTNRTHYLPDPFSLGPVYLRYEAPPLPDNAITPEYIFFTPTQVVAAVKQYTVGSARLSVRVATNCNAIIVPTEWQFAKHYPPHMTGGSNAAYHTCFVTNVQVVAASEDGEILPRLNGPTYIQDARFSQSSAGYVETNNAFLVANSVELNRRLAEISKTQSDRSKALRSKGMQRWKSIAIASLVFIPLIGTTVWLTRYKQTNEKS